MSLTDDLLRIAVAAADEVSETPTAPPQHLAAAPIFEAPDYPEMPVGLDEPTLDVPPPPAGARDNLLSVINEAFAPPADAPQENEMQPSQEGAMSIFDLDMAEEAQEVSGATHGHQEDLQGGGHALSAAVGSLRNAGAPQDLNEFNRHISSGEAMRLDPSGAQLRTTIRAMMRREA